MTVGAAHEMFVGGDWGPSATGETFDAEADLPPGVFNLVTGPGPVVGDEIARNPGTEGVAFIGWEATASFRPSCSRLTLHPRDPRGPGGRAGRADPVAERAARLLGRVTLVQAHELSSRLGSTGPF